MADSDVTYTVKELIGRLDVKLDVLIGKVDGKADAASLGALQDRVVELEKAAAGTEAAARTTRFILYTAIPTVAGLTGVVSRFLH